jgi:hypothetical protein
MARFGNVGNVGLGPAKADRGDPRVRQCRDEFAAVSGLTRAYADRDRAACAVP